MSFEFRVSGFELDGGRPSDAAPVHRGDVSGKPEGNRGGRAKRVHAHEYVEMTPGHLDHLELETRNQKLETSKQE
jgi:hypothetical protein